MPRSKPTIGSVTDALFETLDEVALADLRTEDPATAVEVHFAPIRLQALPARQVASGDCSTDGYYEVELDPSVPWILYADDVAATRRRFTILHELGHHLLATVASQLLDDLDRIAGSAAARAEEAVCHRLAGRILVPDELIKSVIGSDRPMPAHLMAIKAQSGASWEAVAVRMASSLGEPAAVVLIREQSLISFATASSRLGYDWWPTGSRTDVNGPLRSALRRTHRAVPETYRYGLSAARRMFCDTAPAHAALAVSVLTDKPSDGHFEILEQPEPAWRERWTYCEFCAGDRNRGWCELCRGHLCRECGRCGCQKPIRNPRCASCGFQRPHRDGAPICRDCEADF